jgi:crossover junction endodeoxyribonuclease RusA
MGRLRSARETVTSDHIGLVTWLRGACTGALLHFCAQTTPSPAHRPRVTRSGITYYEKAYAQYLKDCQRQFAAQHAGTPLDGRLGIVVETIVQRPKTTKLSDPRGDSDNYAKAVLDGLQKAGVVTDDTQFVPVCATRRFTEPGESPGVNLWIGALA